MKRLADVVAQVKPPTRSVRLCLRGDLTTEHERLDDELKAMRGDEAGMGASKAERDLAQRIHDLEEQIREAEVEFVFQAIGKAAWSDLIAQHPPTKAQQQRQELRGIDYNPETFPAAAICASLVEPADASEDDVSALGEVLSLGQWQRLWTACLAANLGDNQPGESSAASAVLRGSKRSSTTARSAASPEASSSGE